MKSARDGYAKPSAQWLSISDQNADGEHRPVFDICSTFSRCIILHLQELVARGLAWPPVNFKYDSKLGFEARLQASGRSQPLFESHFPRHHNSSCRTSS